jgi:GDPmannose 4,6-dehydratase
MRPSDLRYGAADPSRAAKNLGWRASVSMEEVVRRMVAAEQARTLRLAK